MSDRHTKSGEDMMEVLAHDIMRYETLSEPSDLFALASALVGNAPNDQYTVIELNVPAVPQVVQPTPIDKENIEVEREHRLVSEATQFSDIHYFNI
jgi:hypothetical protein